MQASAIARLFSPSVLKEMARSGRSALFAAIVREVGSVRAGFAGLTVGDFFDHAFSLLRARDCRSEYVYKAALTQKVLLGTHSLQTASMLTEFRVGQCKADVVILNGTGTVYEIKSERDSLSRLSRQMKAYGTVFPLVNVIVGERHVADVLATVHPEVGVMELSHRYRISTVRAARPSTAALSPLGILDSLTIREAQLLLRELGHVIPSVPNTQRFALLQRYFSPLDPLEAHEAMVKVLRRTRSLSSLSSLVDALPRSLHSLVLSTKVRRQDYPRIVAAVSTPLHLAASWGGNGLSPVFPR